jgi:uncharacterized membrane protein (UPF0182 family)
MNAVDTNVLFYARDNREPTKQAVGQVMPDTMAALCQA